MRIFAFFIDSLFFLILKMSEETPVIEAEVPPTAEGDTATAPPTTEAPETVETAETIEPIEPIPVSEPAVIEASPEPIPVEATPVEITPPVPSSRPVSQPVIKPTTPSIISKPATANTTSRPASQRAPLSYDEVSKFHERQRQVSWKKKKNYIFSQSLMYNVIYILIFYIPCVLSIHFYR